MTLLDELKEIDGGYSGLTPDDVLDEVDCKKVYDGYEGSTRWAENWFAVFARGDELAGMGYQVPATEMQEGGDFDYEFFAVEPYTVTETRYKRVT